MYKTRNLKNITRIFPVMFLILFASCIQKRDVTVPELTGHIKYLASDSLKGRETGSQGDSLATDYIRKELADAGYVPLSGDGFQRFKVITRLAEGPGNYMSVNDANLIPGEDFMTMSISSNAELGAEVVFAGFGFNISDEKINWNDYRDIDVTGKWAMIFRSDPDADKADSPFIPYNQDRDKVLTARDMGAAGVLLVSGSAFDPQDSFESPGSEDMSAGIPVLRIKRQVADRILSKKGKSSAELEKSLTEKRKPAGFSTGTMVKAVAEIIRESGTTRNVVMMLPGESAILRDECIVLGAHSDHLGMGGKGSSSMKQDTVAVHHGADDNASGVAMMLEIAEKFARTRGSHPRSIICVAFSGEEKGLLGSNYFVNNPLIDLSKVNVMLNLDMVGRLQESKILQISGVGTSDNMKNLIESLNDSSSVRLALSEAGYGPSDHSSFYSKRIPVLFFTTGAHPDYHTPSDTWDRINYPGMVKVSSLVFGVARELATASERLPFREAGPLNEARRQMRKKTVTIGIMPDVNGQVKNGLRAEIVTPGRPAALAGMKNGDIITAINGKPVANIYDYMSRMAQYKQGQKITVEILRGNDKLTLLIQL